eukprot:8264091-Pyramimonas_sp.AAC.1
MTLCATLMYPLAAQDDARYDAPDVVRNSTCNVPARAVGDDVRDADGRARAAPDAGHAAALGSVSGAAQGRVVREAVQVRVVHDA